MDCATCIYWVRRDDIWGTCAQGDSINGAPVQPHTKAFARAESTSTEVADENHGYEAWLSTAEDFGCNMYRLKNTE